MAEAHPWPSHPIGVSYPYAMFGRKRVSSISPTRLAWPPLTERAYGPDATWTIRRLSEMTSIIDRWRDLFTAELGVDLRAKLTPVLSQLRA